MTHKQNVVVGIGFMLLLVKEPKKKLKKHLKNIAVNSDLWAKGKIILQDEQGNILKEMAQK